MSTDALCGLVSIHNTSVLEISKKKLVFLVSQPAATNISKPWHRFSTRSQGNSRAMSAMNDAVGLEIINLKATGMKSRVN